jgi:hypothetical protein
MSSRIKWLALCVFLMGFTPVHLDYDKKEKIRDEFRNIENTLQDQQFRVVTDTPTLTDLKDHEFVVYSSNTVVQIMFRDDREIYAVRASCVTIRR